MKKRLTFLTGDFLAAAGFLTAGAFLAGDFLVTAVFFTAGAFLTGDFLVTAAAFLAGICDEKESQSSRKATNSKHPQAGEDSADLGWTATGGLWGGCATFWFWALEREAGV